MHTLNGVPGSHAYAMVYGQQLSKATCEANAARLLGSAKAKARRAELIAAKAAAMPISVEYLTREALATIGEARALGQGSAALQGYQLVAKLHGLLVDKVQSEVLVRKPSASPESPDDMAPDEWLNQYASAKLIEQQEPSTVEPEHQPIDDGADDLGST